MRDALARTGHMCVELKYLRVVTRRLLFRPKKFGIITFESLFCYIIYTAYDKSEFRGC